MATPTAEQIAQRAFDVGLLDELQLQKLWAELGSQSVSSEQFMQMLVRRELMTNYQLERLVKGERSGYFFGDYKVLYYMGAGTFARVYRALHRETSQVVAVKVLRKRYSNNRAQYTQFVREGELGRTLRHPNIVPVYEVYSRDSTHFLVMEFVEGRNMREFVKVRGKLAPPEATRLMMDIASGLRYAFDRGLTHRDLKMTNVLVSSRGRAKLVDFGLAAGEEAAGEETPGELASARTIDYAALERATGVRKDDSRSDIYFMGCIFYHMLTGTAPLPEIKDRVPRLSKARFVQVTPVQELDPSLPHAVTLVVNKAMELDPDRRYQTPSAILADLAMLAQRFAEQGQVVGQTEYQTDEDRRERERLAALMTKREHDRSVMVVESNPKMQDLLRDGLKRAGYRVLVFSDPRGALERFRQEASAADCVLFNAQQIGTPALDTFNRFGDDRIMRSVPAVLLLGENQQRWKEKANTEEHRIVLSMPVSMKQLRKAVAQLIEQEVASEASGTGSAEDAQPGGHAD